MAFRIEIDTPRLRCWDEAADMSDGNLHLNNIEGSSTK